MADEVVSPARMLSGNANENNDVNSAIARSPKP